MDRNREVDLQEGSFSQLLWMFVLEGVGLKRNPSARVWGQSVF